MAGIATDHGLDGLGIKSSEGRVFPHLSRRALGCTQPPIHGYQVFPGEKQPGHGVDHPPPARAEVKERVPLQAFVACSRVNFTFLQFP